MNSLRNFIKPISPNEIIHALIPTNGFFPNNNLYPFLLYKQVLLVENEFIQEIQTLLSKNHWGNSWIDSIYDYDHYHSNTHEVLVIISGSCGVQVGGPNGKIYFITKGDVIIFPAGVAHKSLTKSDNFTCIGAYPHPNNYDMNYGKAQEHPRVDENIKRVKLPKADPIFGVHATLFDYWKEKNDDKLE